MENRIRLIKKLLIVNGFSPSTHPLVMDKSFSKGGYGSRRYSIHFIDDSICFNFQIFSEIQCNGSLIPLRVFIKLSNQP